MALTPGSRLGPYEIVAPIGAGGMGEVYRGRDPRLGREVAIKVLPASFSQDADRLRRFEQEARAAGVLNHPNITAVYDIGSADDAPYVVQELLEGETLRSVLAGGRLSPRKAIDYATQIAHGLAAAHEKGIVHRDLKPENLFVTRDGRVKILDFGLAKLTHQEEGSQVTGLPTATAGTEPGVVLGTLGYMSPEQVRGRAADARSDIFSFGAILYEMLSGNRAFRGDSAADTMSAILREDPPDLSVTNQNVSPGLERIVRHCLEKNPEQRFHSAHDVAFALDAVTGSSIASALAPSRVHRRFPWAIAAAAVAVAAAFLAGRGLHAGGGSPALPTYQRLTYRRGNIGLARFAPDGKSVVYGASWEGKPLEIFTLRPGLPESTPVGFPNADLMSVSSKGELALSLRDRFLTGAGGAGTLARAPLGGGAPREILEFVEFADWSPDGKDLAVIRFREGKNRVEFPIGKVLYSTAGGYNGLRFSPRGDRLAFFERRSGLMVLDLSGKVSRVADTMRSQRLAWSPSGDEIWVDDRADSGEGLIRAVRLDGRSRVLLRAPDRLLVHDISSDGRVLVERATGRKSILWHGPGETGERDLAWFDGSDLVGMSADGKTLLMAETVGGAGGPSGSFFLRRTDGSPAVRLGDGRPHDLSPDGKSVIVEASDRKSLTLVPTGTGTPVSIGLGGMEISGEVAFFADGKRIVAGVREGAGKPRRLAVIDVPAGRPRIVSLDGFDFSGKPVTPDGKWIVAFRDWEEDLFLFPVDGGDPKSIPDSKRIDPVRWSSDGKYLFAVETGSIPIRLVRIDPATGKRDLLKELAPPDLTGMIELFAVHMSADGSSYAYVASRAVTSDLFLVEGLK